MTLSRTKIDRAGGLLRRYWTGAWEPENDEDDARLAGAYGTVLEYRAGFQDPLNKVTMGVRSFVSRESARLIVAQRLKRMPAILNKLERFSSMRLSQMEDIGGCRAILRSDAEVNGVLRRIRRNWDVVFQRDYVAEPKDTGYRAVHVIVERQGRFVEIQLRTDGEHDWAEAVERTAARTGHDLKDGLGPPELVTYFEMAAVIVHLQERDLPVDEGFMQVFRNLRERVRHFFTQP